MPKQAKLIKQGILLTDSTFKDITQRLSKGVRESDTLESFLAKHKDYTLNNPLVVNGYKDELTSIILQETNNHRFSRPAQKELTRATIENRVGDLISRVGDDVRENVRNIVLDGYNNGLSQDKIAENITNKVTGIGNSRARAIARTEIARTATASDYVINVERGATHFTVDCRESCCEKCAEAYQWGAIEYSIDDIEMLPPYHPNCYMPDTEVFTNHGWKYFNDITETDKILSLNPVTNETEFLDYVKLVEVNNVHGFMYHIHHKWFDICVTPDHDCFIHQRRDGGKRGRYFEPQFRKPSELNSESHFLRCIDTDRENPKTVNVNGLEFKPSDFAFFMAWFISEGSVLHNPLSAKSHGYPIKISQQKEDNRRIIEKELQRICGYLGLSLAIGETCFEVHSKQLYDYLKPLGYSHEKYIPKEVFSLNKECLNIFLDNYVLGDGHVRLSNKYNSIERRVFTSSPRLKDDLCYLILLCGFNPSVSIHSHEGKVVEHNNGVYTQNHDIYGIGITKSKYINYSSCTVDKIPYNGIVYCVELPKYHTLWVKRNGKVSWNGNCRCYARFYKKDGEQPPLTRTPSPNNTSTTVDLTNTQLKNLKPTEITEEKSNLKPPFDKSKHLTKEQLDDMDFKQLAEHHEVKYEGVKVYDYDKRKYHTFKQTFDDGREFTLRFEDGAVKSYTNKGIATPNEIIHEVFKVPEVLRKETREIWFKNTNHGIEHTYTKTGYDTLAPDDGGYNLKYASEYIKTIDDTDFNHRIVINPKYFKGGGKGKYAIYWEFAPDDARDWKMTIHHEFIHSGDQPKVLWEELKTKEPHYIVNDRLSVTEEYKEIQKEEPYFTWYADVKDYGIHEAYAEHGGYIARMESNPSEQNMKIKVTVLENGKVMEKNINYEEYIKLYPEHHDYFMRKFKEGFKK